ncbi:MAG: UDP-N-acetylglucosamine 2-epimerase (hydrolyzing) [Bacteroidetes bacterium]|nr:UDP-N-acetylglucosamine 2-epimerase (hydrolyzing) [Bacteroidota bacterium]
MNKRKVIVVTGARSEYDIVSPILEKLNIDIGFDLQLLVTGSHLSENFGKTVKNIETDGFIIADRVYNLVNTDEKIGRAISLGHQIPAFAQTIQRVQPDFIFITGDREDALAAAITGAYMDKVVVHLAGGDIAKDGNIDNSARYAVGKFAHIHLTLLDQHKETLLKLGEDAWRIFVVGNPALDKFISTPTLTTDDLSKKLNFSIGNDKYLVLIQHPIISDYEKETDHIRQTLDAIIETGLSCFVNFPNSDAGSFKIIQEYRHYANKYSSLYLFQNLDRITFVNLLRHASCLVGNSSSGIIEAPSIGLPVVNVGKRQKGRIHSGNVIFTDNDKKQIKEAILKSVNDKEYIKKVKKCANPYGDGKSADRIVKILKNIKIDDRLLYKNITY